MKKLLYTLKLVSLSTLLVSTTKAQAPFNTIEYNDINNIKAAVLVHGDMWWDPTVQEARCEFPKGSGKNAQFATALWMAGYDNSNQLHASAQTYRQSGNDYWPGPLDINGNTSYNTSQQWARIWKINKSTIDSFKTISLHTLTNTSASILEWPAKNNPYAKGANNASLTVTTDMAPFVDVNNDGNYNPLSGDYPKIKGDQMLWWIFNDNGPTHNNETNASLPLKIEIMAAAYAYKRGTLIDNVIYYEYYLKNKSAGNFNNFRVALLSDIDLGYYHDDYVGFDSSQRLAFAYNGTSVDGNGNPMHYGDEIPVSGITLLRIPGDNSPNAYRPTGSFMYYNNDFSALGNPQVDTQYNNYMRAKWRNGSHLVYPGASYPGYGSGTPVNYVFNGNPGITTQWSECALLDVPGDRRYVVASDDYSFNAGASTLFAFALVITDTNAHYGCPNVDLDNIREVTDTAWGNFNFPLGVSDQELQPVSLNIYPNPVHDILYLNVQGAPADLQVYNTLGSRVTPEVSKKQDKLEVNVSVLPPGMYQVLYNNKGTRRSSVFIKE